MRFSTIAIVSSSALFCFASTNRSVDAAGCDSTARIKRGQGKSITCASGVSEKKCENIEFQKHCPTTCDKEAQFCDMTKPDTNLKDSTAIFEVSLKKDASKTYAKKDCDWVMKQNTEDRCTKIKGVAESCRRTCRPFLKTVPSATTLTTNDVATPSHTSSSLKTSKKKKHGSKKSKGNNNKAPKNGKKSKGPGNKTPKSTKNHNSEPSSPTPTPTAAPTTSPTSKPNSSPTVSLSLIPMRDFMCFSNYILLHILSNC